MSFTVYSLWLNTSGVIQKAALHSSLILSDKALKNAPGGINSKKNKLTLILSRTMFLVLSKERLDFFLCYAEGFSHALVILCMYTIQVNRFCICILNALKLVSPEDSRDRYRCSIANALSIFGHENIVIEPLGLCLARIISFLRLCAFNTVLQQDKESITYTEHRCNEIYYFH